MWASCCTEVLEKFTRLSSSRRFFCIWFIFFFVIRLFICIFSSFYHHLNQIISFIIISHSVLIPFSCVYFIYNQSQTNIIYILKKHNNIMLILDIGVTVGPLIGYISQLKLIKKTNSLGSFSIDVCAILLISNILRLYFWFTTGYAFNLFIQSILLIIIQLMLLQECVKVQNLEKSMFDV